MNNPVKYGAGLVMLALCGHAFAVPSIGNVTAVQDAMRIVTINYRLADEAAIVTVDVQTNGVSIGDANLTHFAGDAFRVVQPGNRTIVWRPRKAWPDHKITDNSVSYVLKAWSLDNPPDYMVVDLVTPNTVNYYVSAEQLPDGLGHEKYRMDKLVMRRIPAAYVKWRMGSPEGEPGRQTGEDTRYVTLTADYYMGVFELTQGQFAAIAGEYPRTNETGDDLMIRPVDAVTVVRYLNDPAQDPATPFRGGGNVWPTDGHNVDSDSWLGKIRIHSGIDFDMPTSAQWEFACRAETGSAIYTGEDMTDPYVVTNIGWTAFQATGKTMPVGLLKPNGYGLYDMIGNVWEHCLDRRTSGYTYPADSTDPEGPEPDSEGTHFVRRGGGVKDLKDAKRYRSASVHGNHPWHQNTADMYTGYRICAPLPQP